MKYAWQQLLNDRGYKILDTLGEGAYSKVKAAYSSELGGEVAIKCISFRGAPKDFIDKFLPRELKILPLLCHKNIVQVYEILEHYDVDKNSSYVCIVMESAIRGDLLKYIQRRGALPESEIKRFFWQLCQAISYCHSQNICHRDLKCENLLLDRNYNILITDFGFAKPIQYDDNGDVQLSSTFCGSAAYAAPEILQGIPYDPRVHDMWSLGVILYIMACGRMPFDDTNVKRMLKIQLRNFIRFSSKANGVLPQKLKNLIRRLLEVDVAKRYTAAETLHHPFFEGYHGESFSRLISRKICDFFTGGKTRSLSIDLSEKHQTSCSSGVNEEHKKRFRNCKLISLPSCTKPNERLIPVKEKRIPVLSSHKAALKRIKLKLKQRQFKRRIK